MASEKLTIEEESISASAVAFVKQNKNALLRKFASLDVYSSDSTPVTVFMAGAPGAGKTEFSKRLLYKFQSKVVRIDADEIRDWLPKEGGVRSSVYQAACTLGVNKLYDHCLENALNVVLDGTFAYADAKNNVRRSIEKGRIVQIYFLFQRPEDSWAFTKEREKKEGRDVPKDVFIRAFTTSIQQVNEVKAYFGDGVELTVVVKNYNTGLEEFSLNARSIEDSLITRYSATKLRDLLI